MPLSDAADIALVVIAALALVISARAYFLGVKEAEKKREHERDMARPALDFEFWTTSPVRLFIVNNGIGPARLVNTKMWLDGEPVGPMTTENWGKVIEVLRLPGIAGHEWFSLAAYEPDDDRVYRGVVGVGREAPVANVLVAGCHPYDLLMKAALSRMKFEIEYVSFVDPTPIRATWQAWSGPVPRGLYDPIWQRAADELTKRAES